ncbi:hypothetical protein KOR34_22980 [Posidoniimonas corsicana]|uniref:PEP-CTERM protein-sorting domain-containing protein n=1 Tax=Posidoniimonas corsicana TaxID=1938618 RepID=A0A5C5VHF5_9BACT|nr:hypothetical protein [Posidoniimonas corsicana]TWT37349.1 hypothetical protein KOR34_22980 [Posidoniimonas corsicana]
MPHRICSLLSGLLICSLPVLAVAEDRLWTGAVSNDVTNAGNWDLGLPTGADRANFRADGSPGAPDLGANNVTWDQLRFNNIGPTHIQGAGVINLNAGSNPAVYSEGGAVGPSVVDPDIVTAGEIQSNGDHDLVFNGSVTAGGIQAFSSTSTYNGDVTVTAEFISANSTIIFNGNYHRSTAVAGIGINNSGSDVTFTTLSSDDPLHPNGANILNLYGNHTIRNGQNNTFNDSRPWGRNGTTNTYSLNGFDDTVPFIGTDNGSTMVIDFGTPGVANSLIWQEGGFNGTGAAYLVEGFDVGLDSLRLGVSAPFADTQLTQITVNGIAYSADDPMTGAAYWSLDGNNFVQVLQGGVPEPSASTLLLLALAGSTRRRSPRGGHRRSC